MDELANRSRTFAEAVVTMVWLVLLALALDKPKWKSGVPGLDIPNYMIFLAGSTIITGICPLLACCILENLHAISNMAALFSAVMLFFLANWIASFTVSDDVIMFWVAAVFLACMVFRISSYYWVETEGHGHPARTNEFHTILDGSHEFSCCMTGIHFLWLESLALGGLINKSNGIQNAHMEVMGIVNIISCAVGLCTMYIEMAPPLTSGIMGDLAVPIFGFDTFMFFSILTVLGAAMWKSMVFRGLLLLIVVQLIIIGPLIAAFVLVLHVSSPEAAGGNQDTEAGGNQDNDPVGSQKKEAGGNQDNEPPKLAPLGLTKLMVTGFLTVSINVSSPDVGITNLFQVFAAAAIVSGLTWRLLTQAQVWETLENKEQVKNSKNKEQVIHVSQEKKDRTAAVACSANMASFCTHTFVAIATVLLIFEICM